MQVIGSARNTCCTYGKHTLILN